MRYRTLPDPLRPLRDDKAVEMRFRENLVPSNRHKGEKFPGEVLYRLIKAGCPGESVILCLFGYATSSRVGAWLSFELQRLRQEAARVVSELERMSNGLERLVSVFEPHQYLYPGSTWIEDAHAVTSRTSELIPHLRSFSNRRPVRSRRTFGHQPLEWLAILQCYAECVGSPLTESDLAALVWAAVSAVRPKAKRIETDTLAQAPRRFWRRNRAFRGLLRCCLPKLLTHGQEEARSERR